MSREILKITGEDREHFLQGLVSNDVTRLKHGLVYTAMLTPQGKYIADFFLVPAGDAILLDVDVRLAPMLMQRLTMYKLRSKVSLEPAGLCLHRGLGAVPEGAFADPRHEALGWRAYREDPQGEDKTDWDALRIALGVPETGTELTPDSFILEMGFERLNGVDFKKGCYVGQEVTARMKHKTELRKGLARIEGEAPLTEGAEIISGGKAAGTVLSVAGTTALAYLRFDRTEAGLEAEGQSLSFERLD